MAPEDLAIVTASFVCIGLELFLTAILNLKAWNHVVYTIIPFAILGYGIGANLYLIAKGRVEKAERSKVIALALAFLGLSSIGDMAAMIALPIRVGDVLYFFNSFRAAGHLMTACLVFMVPFVSVGFLVTFLFSNPAASSSRLYCLDLLGAGAGAAAFFPLIYRLQVVRSILVLSVLPVLAGVWVLRKHRRWLLPCLAVGLCLVAAGREPADYNVDRMKGWEWIPGYFKPNQYETLLTRWHPLGRTDIYRVVDPAMADTLYSSSSGTLEINLEPRPEFSYFSTNFLAGTPAYKLSDEGLKEHRSRLALFSQGMEFPYVLLHDPRVVVIGTGGGRDIFMARSHGARGVVGAEVNPMTYRQMSAGGALFDYTGRIYEQPGVKVYEADGRHLVKTLPSGSVDLLVLNGVDTFTGLSSGAYAYAESYLYTKDAVEDFLRVLDSGGMINFNRWGNGREDLRLFAIALAALRQTGAERPWRHIVMGYHRRWSMMLVKKSPFNPREIDRLNSYFKTHDTTLTFPTRDPEGPAPSAGVESVFDAYGAKFAAGQERAFTASYPTDISVITDDDPFFYKYYRFGSFNPFHAFAQQNSGTVVFMTQTLMLLQACLFIGCFIFAPLFALKRSGIRAVARRAPVAFVAFFACLGIGFMFIEIPVMQKFTLLLGSPLYSIPVTLAALLIWSGLGSFLYGRIRRKAGFTIKIAAAALGILIVLLASIGPWISDLGMAYPFVIRAALVSSLLLPLGACLGMFFPAGLSLVSKKYQDAVAWAWGINCGCSVLGSIVSLILAQFLGFNSVLLLAAALYLCAALAFARMESALSVS